MRRSLLYVCWCCALTWMLSACGENRLAYVVDDDGQLRRQTPELMQSRDEDRLRRQLRDAEPAISSIVVEFSQPPQPVYDENFPTEWRYDEVQARIRIAAVVTDEAALRQQLHDLSLEFLRERRLRVASELSAIVEVSEASAVPGQPYTIQAGDTVADISTAFYGSPEHWRSIMRANPGLDAANLAVGTTIVIPEREPSAAAGE